jgi:hypothetical protein
VLTRDVREISLTKEKSETDPCLRLWINCQHSTTILSLLFISTSASILTFGASEKQAEENEWCTNTQQRLIENNSDKEESYEEETIEEE